MSTGDGFDFRARAIAVCFTYGPIVAYSELHEAFNNLTQTALEMFNHFA